MFENKKILLLDQIADVAKRKKKKNEKIGLITGCFDVIHCGHVEAFRFAKRQCDVLIVGLDNDENIRKNKGDGRPIFNFAQRAAVISEMESVDYLFKISSGGEFNSNTADQMLEELLDLIRPNFLFCHLVADPALSRKKKSCQKFNVKIVLDRSKKDNSSTNIIKIIRNKYGK